MHEQLKQIGNLKRKMRGLSLRGFIHHLMTDRTLACCVECRATIKPLPDLPGSYRQIDVKPMPNARDKGRGGQEPE